jgi:hypothetical protein
MLLSINTVFLKKIRCRVKMLALGTILLPNSGYSHISNFISFFLVYLEIVLLVIYILLFSYKPLSLVQFANESSIYLYRKRMHQYDTLYTQTVGTK